MEPVLDADLPQKVGQFVDEDINRPERQQLQRAMC